MSGKFYFEVSIHEVTKRQQRRGRELHLPTRLRRRGVRILPGVKVVSFGFNPNGGTLYINGRRVRSRGRRRVRHALDNAPTSA